MRQLANWARKLAPISLVLLAAASASAHPERPTTFPDYPGSVPRYRTTGPALVVCADDSRARIRATLHGRLRERNLSLYRRCRFRQIQDAINAAGSGYRIMILPGVYREPRSLTVPVEDPACARYWTFTTHGDARGTVPKKYLVPSYEYWLHCPNARGLITIVGALGRDPQHRCDVRCDLQLEGTGADPGDVVIEGDRRKLDIIHVDRADGVYLRNLTVQYAAFNGVNVIETNGFALEHVVSRFNQNYGVLTFTDDNGLYDHVTTYGNGHAGVYPGSAAKRERPLLGGLAPPLGRGTTACTGEHSIELRAVDSYENTYGYSGTAANAVWVHDSRFHDNATGVSTDSTASAHPGMPQACARFEHNEIYANNFDVFTPRNEKQCAEPFAQRDPRLPCPYYAAPVGTGMQIAGGNQDTVSENYIYDNWRGGVRLFWTPAPVRVNVDPTKLYDTSNGNRFIANHVGVRPDGSAAPNGSDGDFWWDGEGVGNCWSANQGPGGRAPTSDPLGLQSLYPCTAGNAFAFGNPFKIAGQLPCALYDPKLLPNPPGCAFINRPPPPR